jgi:transcriptional regulator with XRE-family HTH domain
MNMDKKTEVGLRLKQLRIKQGISQKDLAELCGWGPSRISNYESGLRSINLDDAEVFKAHIINLLSKISTKLPIQNANNKLMVKINKEVFLNEDFKIF